MNQGLGQTDLYLNSEVGVCFLLGLAVLLASDRWSHICPIRSGSTTWVREPWGILLLIHLPDADAIVTETCRVGQQFVLESPGACLPWMIFSASLLMEVASKAWRSISISYSTHPSD
jgi:hypothetical protein